MSRPWMPLYIGDYLANTSHLNAAQHGAYLLLIMHYWQKNGLPDDDDQLAMIARMSAQEWRKNKPVLRAFFGAGWRHERIEAELAEAEAAYERRAKAGRKGALAKHKPSIAGGNARRNASDNAGGNEQAGAWQSQSPIPTGYPSQVSEGDNLGSIEGTSLRVIGGER